MIKQTIVAAAATLALVGSADAYQCKHVSPMLLSRDGGTTVKIVFPVKLNGRIDIHFGLPPEHARKGGDTQAVGVCAINEGKVRMTTAYRVKFDQSNSARLVFAYPSTGPKGSAPVSAKVSGRTFYAEIQNGAEEIQFREGATPKADGEIIAEGADSGKTE